MTDSPYRHAIPPVTAWKLFWDLRAVHEDRAARGVPFHPEGECKILASAHKQPGLRIYYSIWQMQTDIVVARPDETVKGGWRYDGRLWDLPGYRIPVATGHLFISRRQLLDARGAFNTFEQVAAREKLRAVWSMFGVSAETLDDMMMWAPGAFRW